MNKSRTIRTTTLAVALAVALIAPCASNAAPAGVYRLLTGVTTGIPATSTNKFMYGTSTNAVNIGAPGTSSNYVAVVDEFDYVGFTAAETGASGSTNTFYLFKSFDGGRNYETTPSFSYTAIPGAAAWVTNAALDVHGVTHLALRIESTGSGVATNAYVAITLKSPKFGSKQATR